MLSFCLLRLSYWNLLILCFYNLWAVALHCLILLTILSAPRVSGPRFYNLAGRCRCLQSDGLKSVFKTDAISQMTMMDARDFARLRSCHNHDERHRPKNGFKPVWCPYEQAPRLFDATPNGSLSYYRFLLSTFTCKHVCLLPTANLLHQSLARSISVSCRIWE